MTPGKRGDLAREVYEAVIESTESIEGEEDHIGADLALLMGAILTEGAVELGARNAPFRRILDEHFEEDHAVWAFVAEAEDDGDGVDD